MNTYNPDSTTCTPICGDGMMKPGEICDDGNLLDNKGCKPDCSGNLPGWNCLGGSLTTPVTCIGICADGYIKGTE